MAIQALSRVFTTIAFDNIDHNPRATTCRTSFHGSCLSVLQFPTSGNPGVAVGPECILNPGVSGRKAVGALPLTYTAMEEVSLAKDNEIYVPDLEVNNHLKAEPLPLRRTIEDGYQWLEHAHTLMLKEELELTDWISWAAYHASRSTSVPTESPSAILPIFRESASSPMMVNHAMYIAIAVTNHLNPGQTPVIVADQPLFTVMKKLQRRYPETVGEHKMVIMLGAMHIEKMLWEVNGSWFEGSGWKTAVTNSRVASSGVVDSFIGVSHLTRTRYMHQVSITNGAEAVPVH